MLRPEPLAPLSPLSPNVEATRPTAPATNGGAQAGGRFAPLFAEVSADVGRFIEQGSRGGAGGDFVAAAMLSPEASLLRASTKAAAVPSATLPEDEDARRAFVAGIRPWAEQAAGRLGVSPDLVIAHAALESGWGQRPIRAADGRDSHNLFGIKAGAGWRADAVSARTTEFMEGSDVQVEARFRAYPDGASAFRDYARLLGDSPRYAGALNAGTDAQAFADGLVRGGYATDPAYADKLVKVAAAVRDGRY